MASTRGSSAAGTRLASGSPSSSPGESNPYISAVARLANTIRWSLVTTIASFDASNTERSIASLRRTWASARRRSVTSWIEPRKAT